MPDEEILNAAQRRELFQSLAESSSASAFDEFYDAVVAVAGGTGVAFLLSCGCSFMIRRLADAPPSAPVEARYRVLRTRGERCVLLPMGGLLN